jgi:hypothetical protein
MTSAQQSQQSTGRTARRRGGMACAVVAVLLVAASASGAEAPRPEPSSAIGGGAMARVLPPAEKIKVLEEELAKETERRLKVEQESARRLIENNELTASTKLAARERASVEARLGEAREREQQLQHAIERLREANARIAMAVRLSLPIVTAACIAILVLLIWAIVFLRKLAARVHDQHTLAEMRELEGRLAHANDQYNAELKRNQTLRHKLAELGIVDEEAPRMPSGQWRTR